MRSNLITLFVGLSLSATLVACGDEPKKRPLGGTCDSDGDCVSGFCAEGVCLAPEGDDDDDGIINRIEVLLGSNPLRADTDDDGFDDGEEIVNQSENVDTDGDAIPDIIESTVADADDDCMPDQYDPENSVASDDLSPMIDVVCSKLGVCAGQRDAMSVSCPDGTAICVYAAVVGYESPETKCNAADENCDGDNDEAFDDRDGDGLANCVDSDWDNDGVADGTDNCPVALNPTQEDGDADGIGDLCVSAYTLVFLSAPEAAVVGIDFSASVGIAQKEGDAEAPLPPFRGVVSLTLDANGSAATLTGTATATAGADGSARWSGLGVTAPGQDLTLTATSGGLAPVDSATFDAASGALTSFRIEGVPSEVTAGVGVPFTITPLDQNGNVILDYEGTVTLTSTDPEATADGTLLTEAGLDVNLAAAPDAIAFYRTGSVTFTVTETGGSATGFVTTTVSDTGFAELEVLTSASNAVAGEAFTVTITARDAFGNVASAFDGVVTLAVNDGAATLPATSIDFSTLDADRKTFSGEVVLRTAGARTLTATDGTVTGTADMAVTAAAASQFVVVTSAAQVAAGAAFDVTVSARDPFGNVDTTFEGTVDIVQSDLATTLPASYTFVAGDLGVHTFSEVTLGTAGTQSITVNAGALTGSVTVDIIAGNLSALVVRDAPASVVAGVPFSVQIELRDAQGNLGVDGSYTIHVVYPDGSTADLQISTAFATLTGLVLTDAGSGVVTLSLVGVSGAANTITIDVASAAASRLALVAPATVVAGTPHNATLTAYDAFDNVATGYRGTVTFTTSNAAGDAPAAFTFTAQEAGIKDVTGFVGRTAATATLTATDGTRSANDTVAYTPAPAARVGISGLAATSTAGGSLGFTVTVYDAYDNVATGYLGTITVTSTDAGATLPTAHTFTVGDAGVFAFTGLVLDAAGPQTVTVSDGTLADDSVVDVTPANATRYDVVLADTELAAGVTTSLVVTARDAFGNVATGYRGTVRFTSSDPQPQLPPNYAFTANDNGQKTFGNVAFRTVGSQSVTATDTVTASITGADTLTVQQGNDIVFVLQSAPTTIAAGTSFGLTLRVEDAFGNLITNYGGRVAFTSTDPLAVLPALFDFTGAEGGIKAFTGINLKTAGARSVVITDQDDTAVSATAIVDVTPLAMSSLELVCTPLTLTAGGASSCTVRALDVHTNVATSYRGTVTFTSTDPAATLPVPTAYGASDAGTRTFPGIVFETAGQRTLTIADGATTDNATFTVNAGAATALTITPATGTSVAGVAFNLTVTAQDAFGNVATSYRGSVGFGVDAGNATLPGTYTFTAADNGAHTFTGGFTLQRAGLRTITVTGTAIANATAQATRTIDAAAATKLTVASNLTTVVAGQQLIELTVTAKDQFDNTAPGYRGTVRFAVDAGGSTFPPNYTFVAADNGVHAFQAAQRSALQLVGARVVTVSDTTTTTITGTSGTINVTPAAVASFVVSAPPSATSGIKFNTTVEARDLYGNTASGYRGTVVFSVDSGTGSFPVGYTFTAVDAGVHAFDSDPNRVALNLAGTRVLTVRDSLTSSITGASGNISIAPGAPTRFTITGMPTTMVAGGSATLTLTVFDGQDNVATNYTGTFNVTSSDPSETFPATVSVSTGGTATFSGGFRTVPTPATNQQTLTIANAIATVQVGALVTPAAAHTVDFTTALTETTAGVAFNGIVRVRDQYNNIATGYTGGVSLTSSDAQATLPGAYTFVAATDRGERTFAFTLKTVGPALRITVTATGGLTNATDFIDLKVNPAGAATLVVTAGVTTASAGQLIPFSIEARDAFGNRATGYTGTVQGNADSGGGTWQGGTLPRSYTFLVGDAGFRSFNSGNEQLSFNLVGTRRIVATDTVTATITGQSQAITVGAGSATSFTLTPALPTSSPAGTTHNLTISTFDGAGNAAPYTGSFTILSSDPLATPLTAVSFSNQSSKAFSITLATAGSRSVTARNNTLGGDKSVSTNVTPLAASKLVMTSATTGVAAGTAFTVTVAARDTYNNLVPTYTGVARFSAPNDPLATVPGDYTFTSADAGDRDFSVTLRTARDDSAVTVNDSSFTNGSSTLLIDVTASAATKIKVDITPVGDATAGTAFTLTGTIQDAHNNTVRTFTGPVKITSTDTQATSPTITFAAADQGVKATSYTLFTAGTRTVTMTHDIAGGITGNTTKNVVAAAFTKLAFSTQPTAGFAGENLPSFSVQAQDAWSNPTVATGTFTLSLPVNPGGGRLTGTISGSFTGTMAGSTIAMAAARITRPAVGYLLQVRSGAVSANSSSFDVAWRPPVLSAGTSVRTGGCVDVGVSIAQSGAANVDVDIQYDVVGDSPDVGYASATQAGTIVPLAASDFVGVTGLPTSATATARKFRWDATRDLGRFQAASVNLRAIAYADGVTTTFQLPGLNFDASYKTTWVATDAGGTTPKAMAAADFNRDGLMDIVVARGTNTQFSIYRGGPTALAAALNFTIPVTPTPSSTAIAAGDLNGDGFPDVVLGDPSSQDRAVILTMGYAVGGGTTLAITATQQTGKICEGSTSEKTVAIGQLDADRELEFVFTCEGNKGVTLMQRNGQGLWVTIYLAKATSVPTAVEIADLDKDGDNDIVIGSASGTLQVYRNSGDGSFVATAETSIGSTNRIWDLALADIDEDGDLDAVAGDDVVKQFRIAFGKADGNPATVFFQGTGAAVTDNVVRSVAIGDVDANGVLDLIGGSVADDRVVVVRSTGWSGGVSARVAVPTGSVANGGPIGVAIGDLNRDGIVDILTARGDIVAATDSVGFIYQTPTALCDARFDGPGHVPDSLFDMPFTKSFDYNRDGKQDLLTFAGPSGTTAVDGLAIYLGSGDGRFAADPVLFGRGETYSDVAWGDFNGDGRTDLVMRHRTTGNVRFAAQGTDPYTLAPYAPTNTFTTASDGPVVGDFDLDGDDDVAFVEPISAGDKVHIHLNNLGSFTRAASVDLALKDGFGLALAHLNGDGLADFIVSREGATHDELCPILSTFGTSPIWSDVLDTTKCRVTNGRLTKPIVVTDLESDRNPEIAFVTGTGLTQRLNVYRQSSPGVFDQREDDGSPTTTPEGYFLCQAFGQYGFAQMNGVGDLDLVLECNRGSASELWTIGTFPRSGGRFSASPIAQAMGPETLASLALAELTGDRRADITFGGSTLTQDISLDRVDEPGSFTAMTLPMDATDADFADFDGDGNLDIIAVSAADTTIQLTRQTSPGVFGAPTTLPGVLSDYSRIAAGGDINRDGRTDFAYVSNKTGTPRVVFATQNANGTFTHAVMSPFTSNAVVDVAIADFDGDNLDDVGYAANAFTDHAGIWLQQPAGGYTRRTSGSGTAYRVEVGNFSVPTASSISRAGMAIHHGCDGGSTIHCIGIFTLGGMPGNTFFQSTVDLAHASQANITGWAVADLNRDGRDDIVFIDASNAIGGFLAPAPASPVGWVEVDGGMNAFGPTTRLVSSDINRDGWPDLLILHDGRQHSSLETFLGNTTTSAFPLPEPDHNVESFGRDARDFRAVNLLGTDRVQLLGLERLDTVVRVKR